jgi:hypothetical protein
MPVPDDVPLTRTLTWRPSIIERRHTSPRSERDGDARPRSATFGLEGRHHHSAGVRLALVATVRGLRLPSLRELVAQLPHPLPALGLGQFEAASGAAVEQLRLVDRDGEGPHVVTPGTRVLLGLDRVLNEQGGGVAGTGGYLGLSLRPRPTCGIHSSRRRWPA